MNYLLLMPLIPNMENVLNLAVYVKNYISCYTCTFSCGQE